MRARQRWFAVCVGSGVLCTSACQVNLIEGNDSTEETGNDDGDGDPGDGDGDGDPGDGDGDGDGDPGDGDGDGDGLPHDLPHDLWQLACDAHWQASPDMSSEGIVLDCNSGDADEGAITQYELLELEDGSTAMSVLLVAPWLSDTGMTWGRYSLDLTGAIKPTLSTTVACAKDETESCDVSWQIQAKLASDPDPAPVLEEGIEIYDGQVTAVEVDLSAFTGPTEVTLLVTSNGSASSVEGAVFVAPRIVEDR